MYVFWDVFFGGRIEVFYLFVEVDKNIVIKYYNVMFFYFFINKIGEIFIGYLYIIFKILRIFLWMICKVLVLKGFFIFVLLIRVNGKFLFGLCNFCMEIKIC